MSVHNDGGPERFINGATGGFSPHEGVKESKGDSGLLGSRNIGRSDPTPVEKSVFQRSMYEVGCDLVSGFFGYGSTEKQIDKDSKTLGRMQSVKQPSLDDIEKSGDLSANIKKLKELLSSEVSQANAKHVLCRTEGLFREIVKSGAYQELKKDEGNVVVTYLHDIAESYYGFSGKNDNVQHPAIGTQNSISPMAFALMQRIENRSNHEEGMPWASDLYPANKGIIHLEVSIAKRVKASDLAQLSSYIPDTVSVEATNWSHPNLNGYLPSRMMEQLTLEGSRDKDISVLHNYYVESLIGPIEYPIKPYQDLRRTSHLGMYYPNLSSHQMGNVLMEALKMVGRIDSKEWASLPKEGRAQVYGLTVAICAEMTSKALLGQEDLPRGQLEIRKKAPSEGVIAIKNLIDSCISGEITSMTDVSSKIMGIVKTQHME